MLSHGLIHRVHRLSAGVAVPHYSRIVGHDRGICFFSLWLWRKIAGPRKEHCGDLSLSALLSISGCPNVLCVIFFFFYLVPFLHTHSPAISQLSELGMHRDDFSYQQNKVDMDKSRVP